MLEVVGQVERCAEEEVFEGGVDDIWWDEAEVLEAVEDWEVGVGQRVWGED